MEAQRHADLTGNEPRNTAIDVLEFVEGAARLGDALRGCCTAFALCGTKRLRSKARRARKCCEIWPRGGLSSTAPPPLSTVTVPNFSRNDGGKETTGATGKTAERTMDELPNLSEWSVPSNFRAKRRIDQGAFGIVVVVEDTEDGDREFAIKLFEPIENTDRERVKRRFLRGARFMRNRLEHEHIVRVYTIFGEDTDKPAFLMDYVPGQDLERTLQQATQPAGLTLRVLLEAMIPIVRAVRHAHQRDIIHRDVKPRNILLQRIDSTWRAVLTDFDLAYHPEENITALPGSPLARGRIGTAYMHPEFRQNFDRFADEDSADHHRRRPLDYYSLCAVLFFIITKNDPVRDGADNDSMANVEPSVAHELGSRTRAGRLFGLVRTTLRHAKVAGTPQNVEDIAIELEAILAPRRPLADFGRAVVRLAAGAKADTITKFNSQYLHNPSFIKQNTIALSMAAISIVPAVLIWYFTGTPARLSLTPVFATICFISGRYLLGIAQSNTDAVPSLAIWTHHARKLLLGFTELNFAYWFLASGAVVLVPSLKPPFLEFHDELVAIHHRIFLAESIGPIPTAPSDPVVVPAPKPRKGDEVQIITVRGPTTWLLKTPAAEQEFQFQNVVPFDPAAPDAVKVNQSAMDFVRASGVLRLGDFTHSDAGLLGDITANGGSLAVQLVRLGLLQLDPTVTSPPKELQLAQRSAKEHARGAWAGKSCDVGCEYGAACEASKTRAPCPSGWACVPTKLSLDGRSWTFHVTGANVDSNLWTGAQVCIDVSGRSDCVSAAQAATTAHGAALNVRASTAELNRARTMVRLNANSKSAARPLVLESNQTLLVNAESICKGFSLFKDKGALVRLFLEEG